MERTVGTSLLLQMMRNRVFEVNEEYYLYLNKVEDKLLKYETVSIGEWEGIFKGSNLSQDEYGNFKKIWIEAYVRYYFFRKALKDLPNTTDINTVRRIVTVDDLAYPEILKMKLAYVYGNKIQEYESIVERWTSDEYVIQWLKYETYRKLDDYWDMNFASDHSAFDSVYKYNRASIEGLDSVESVLESAKNFNDLKNVLRFTLYCYNDMILPRAGLDAIQQEYMDYSKNKPTKGYLSEIFKLIDPDMKTFNIYSLEMMLKLCIVRKELAGEKELTNEDMDHVEYVLDGMREYTEAISGRTVVDIYFKEKDAIERNIFPETTGLRVKKRYLLYAMRHYDEFSKEMVSEFAKTTIEEFTEKEFIRFAQQTWSGYRLHTMELWYQALMFGNYIPKYVRQELGCFCNTDELLMTLEVNDLSDDGFFKDMVYYYMTTTCFWEDLNRRVSKYILKNGYLKTWYELLEDGDIVLEYSSFLSHMIPGRAFLFHALQVDNDEYNRYLVSNTRYSFYVYGNEETFRLIANFKVYLESRLYGDLITLKEVRGLLQDYPEYILSAFDALVNSWNLKVSRESLDLMLDLCLVYYLKYQKDGTNLMDPGEVLRLKDEHLKSLTKKTRISNSKAADIFFGKDK